MEMDIKKIITPEKVEKLKPVLESILSRKHGRDISLNEITLWGVEWKKGANQKC